MVSSILSNSNFGGGALQFTSAAADVTAQSNSDLTWNFMDTAAYHDVVQTSTFTDPAGEFGSVQTFYGFSVSGSDANAQQIGDALAISLSAIPVSSTDMRYDWTFLDAPLAGLLPGESITFSTDVVMTDLNGNGQDQQILNLTISFGASQTYITSGLGLSVSTAPSLTVDWSDKTTPVEASFVHGPLIPADAAFIDDGHGSLYRTSGDGLGDQVVYDENASLTLLTGSGDDHLELALAGANVSSGAGNDFISGSFGSDTLDGDDGNDFIEGETQFGIFGGPVPGAADTINGGAGNDTLEGGPGDDVLDGGAGTDTAVYYNDSANFSIQRSNGHVIVTEITPRTDMDRPSGTDDLVNVEFLQFNDVTINLLAPTPGADSLTTQFGKPVTASAASLLANDTDPGGFALSLTAVGGAQHGTVTLSGGNVTFTPFVGYVGAAGFSYTVDDGNGGTATGQVSVNVTGNSPAYIYRGSITAPETIDFTGDSKSHQVLVGSGDTTVLMGSGGGSAHLGAGNDVVIGGNGKDSITFGPGLGTATGGAGPDAFIFVKGQIADPSLHGGQYDTITDFVGAGGWVPGRDFIWLQGFSHSSSVTYEGDLSSDPTAHLYRVDDGAYHAEFVLQYAGPGVALAYGQYGFL